MLYLKAGIINAFMIHAGQQVHKIASDFTYVLQGKLAVIKLTIDKTVIDYTVNEQ